MAIMYIVTEKRGIIRKKSRVTMRFIPPHVLGKTDFSAPLTRYRSGARVKGLKNGFVFQQNLISREKRKQRISKLKVRADETRMLRTILESNFSNIEHGPEN